MSFTDKDFRQLQERISDYLANRKYEVTFNIEKIQALLARLEASERKNRASELHHDADNDGECFKDCPSCKEIKDADEAWRTACGIGETPNKAAAK